MRTMADPEAGPMLPTASLGELLLASRSEAGLSLDEVGAASGLSVDRIAAVEAGRHDLSDVELASLLDRYPIPTISRRFSRAVVEIDLDGGAVRLQRTRRPRSVPAADRNLLHYLSMVHDRFGLEPGSDVPLKAVDLVLLRASLALRREEVTGRLDRMTGAIGPGLARNRSLLAVAAGTGLVVAAGAIVLIPARSSEPTPPAVTPQIDIGTPMVVERDPADVPMPTFQPTGEPAGEIETGMADPAVTAAPAPASIEPGGARTDSDAPPATEPAAPIIEPQIGTPYVLERPADAGRPPSPSQGDDRSRGPPQPTR